MSDEELLLLADSYEAGEVPLEVMLDALEDYGAGRWHWLCYPRNDHVWDLFPSSITSWPVGEHHRPLLFPPEAAVRVIGYFYAVLGVSSPGTCRTGKEAKVYGLAEFARYCVKQRN